MTPKEKARELVAKFKPYSYSGRDEDREWRFENAKQCALIAVDETQQLIKNLSSCKNRFIYIVDKMNYWEEVKQEIEKL